MPVWWPPGYLRVAYTQRGKARKNPSPCLKRGVCAVATPRPQEARTGQCSSSQPLIARPSGIIFRLGARLTLGESCWARGSAASSGMLSLPTVSRPQGAPFEVSAGRGGISTDSITGWAARGNPVRLVAGPASPTRSFSMKSGRLVDAGICTLWSETYARSPPTVGTFFNLVCGLTIAAWLILGCAGTLARLRTIRSLVRPTT